MRSVLVSPVYAVPDVTDRLRLVIDGRTAALPLHRFLQAWYVRP